MRGSGSGGDAERRLAGETGRGQADDGACVHLAYSNRASRGRMQGIAPVATEAELRVDQLCDVIAVFTLLLCHVSIHG